MNVSVKSLSGAFKRMIAGINIFVTQAQGVGRISFSRDGAGQVFAIHLKSNEGIDVREHQFLAATDSVDYTFKRVQGIANMFLGATGFFIDTFKCSDREGILWLHGYGNVFEIVLNAGRTNRHRAKCLGLQRYICYNGNCFSESFNWFSC